MSHTTAQWLDRTLSNKAYLKNWLTRQYIGEFTAAVRLGQLVSQAKRVSIDIRKIEMLTRIQKEEAAHTVWIGHLMQARRMPIPVVTMDPSRYWDKVLSGEMAIEKLFAAGYHAETMRLGRIRGLVSHPKTPADVRQTFTEILRDEEGHAFAFEQLTTPEQRAESFDAHKAGMDAMGLVA